MSSKLPSHFTNFEFISYRLKVAGVCLSFVFYMFILTYFTTSTDDYTLEKQPTESIQPKPDPVLQSLDISIAQLQNMSALTQQIITVKSDSNTPQKVEALRNCTFLFEVAKDQLHISMALLGQGDKVLAAPEILDIGLLIKASLAFQDKCLDGLEKTELMVLDDVRVGVHRSKECISNSSAIFDEIYPLYLRASRRRTCLFHYMCVTSNL